jgi:Family of unknown function (DUF6308)
VARKPGAQIPDNWKQPDPDLLATAKHKALRALRQTGINPAPERLAWFYDINGNYAGATFADLRPNDPWDLTATDLHATMLLSVRIGPGATRRILEEGAARAGLLRKLGQVPELDLAVAGRSELSAMAGLYEAVKQALSADGVKRPNAWVTASKLCARKRPCLFPVRDKKACDYLGLSPFADYQLDWQVYRSLIADPDIVTAVGTLTDATVAGAPQRNLRMDFSPLRLLDAAIWTYAISEK